MERFKTKQLLAWSLLLLSLTLVLGCGAQTVSHLSRDRWQPNTRQSLEMDYFSFQFTSRPQGQEISFTGRAYPLHEQLPSWAEWIADLWIAAYLSDNQGQVLAKDLRMYSSRPLDYEQGIPFSFVLKPSELGSAGPLYVTFGYRLVLTAVAGGHARYDLGLEDEQDVFFANESALSRF